VEVDHTFGIESYSVSYTNSCNFDVNIGITDIGTLRRGTIAAHKSFTYSQVLTMPEFIACRPPAVPDARNVRGYGLSFDVFCYA
jgi:hypothetical protein